MRERSDAMTLNIPDHWRYLLDGFPDTDNGDVITRDGEIIGTWGLLHGALYTFTPNGASEPIFVEPFLGMLTSCIEEWQAEMERAST